VDDRGIIVKKPGNARLGNGGSEQNKRRGRKRRASRRASWLAKIVEGLYKPGTNRRGLTERGASGRFN